MKYSMYDILIRPIVTEKTDGLSAFNKYSFEIATSANKSMVKQAVEAIYNVNVEKVNIKNLKGKVKRFKGRIGKRNDRKQAIVTLKDSQKIDYAGEIK